MKTSHDIQKKACAFSEQEVKNLQTLVTEVKSVLENSKINEDTLMSLTNMITTLSTLKENCMWRIIRAAKQNHMLD
tara:strand:- start:9559 stop:9786 length:228 start_codon:yes stop_codon:yes gene_type:complete